MNKTEFTRVKQELINECLMLSRENPHSIYYGIICANGTTQATCNIQIASQYVESGDKLYCKASDGYLIL